MPKGLTGISNKKRQRGKPLKIKQKVINSSFQTRSLISKPYPATELRWFSEESSTPFILGGILEGPRLHEGLPQRLSGKTPPASAGDTGLIPGTGTSPGEGNGNALQYSCLGSPMDWGAWRATVHGIAKVRHDLATKQTGWVREEPFVGLLSIKKVLSPNQHYY